MTMKVCNALQMFIATGLFGACAASFLIAQNALWPDYFGPLHIGNIRGFSLPVTMGCGAIGGPVAGIIKDTTGAYARAWQIAIVCLALATTLTLFTRKPEPPVNN
jgi:MFS family permease